VVIAAGGIFLGFKDFENKIKDLTTKGGSDHQKAVQQSIDPATRATEINTDEK
jgi:hypothetical protein